MPGRGYYPSLYARDLVRVLPNPGDDRAISICSFLPDCPRGPFFREPARQIRLLRQRDAFVVSAFWEILADQAAYFTLGRDLTRFADPILAPKLNGLLSTANSNIHPAFLLIAMSFGRETADGVALDVRGVGTSFLGRLRESTGTEFEVLTKEMSRALLEDRRPDSIRAFVPFGDEYRLKPNLDFVAKWADAARETLVEFDPHAR